MKLLRRRPVAEVEAEPEEPTPDVVDTVGKGRPTPKRRDTSPQRGPVKAPKTRKEAAQWQRQQTRRSGTSGSSGNTRVSAQAHREALRRGDPDALPKRDRGPARRLARDWVDSHRMISNYLLILFPLMVVGYFVPFLNIAVIALLVVIVVEWYLTGRRIRALAVQRLKSVREGPWSLGFYAGSRAYMPRRWRMPAPQVAIGEQI